MRSRSRTFWLSLFVLLPLASCRTAPMYEPGRVQVQASSQQAMRAAIVESLYARGWLISGESEGVVSARLDVRAHSASIRIAYDTESFEVSYVDSKELDHGTDPDGNTVIHRRYNTWVTNLVRDVSVRAGRSMHTP